MRTASHPRRRRLVYAGLLCGAVGVIVFAAVRPHFSREIRTETEIDAAPEQVWNELSAFESYGEWNPFIREVRGRVAEGEELQVRLQAPNSEERTFRPEVLVAEPGRELRWLVNLAVPGLFAGEHYFLLEPSGSGGTRLVQGESFTGLLVPLLWQDLDTNTRLGFERMNDALEDRIESPRVEMEDRDG